MSTPSDPRPFAAAHPVRGRASELTALMDELEERLAGHGWRRCDLQEGSPPFRVSRLEREDEWLVLALGEPTPGRLRRTFEAELAVTGLVRDAASVHDGVAALPFTPLELEILAFDMPLTASVAERAQAWLPGLALDERPLAGHAAVFTIHHQTDFVLLLEQALSLGIERELVTVIDKEYCYQFSHRVDAHIRQKLGIPVYRYRDLDEGLSEHIRRVEAHRQTTGAATWLPTVVVDDGGYVLPVLREKFEPHLNFFKGVVEQTKSGIWKLRPFQHDLRVPVFSVAESELKATVEARGVAQAAITNLRRLLPQEKLDGRNAIVVGYGVIGQALAELLSSDRVHVHIVDSSAAALVAAREAGYLVGEDLPELIRRVRPRYIFSCAEPGAVGREALEAITSDCALVSLTSRDVAIDKDALAELATAEPLGSVGTLYCREDPDCTMLLIADGFPINFHFAESMPNQQSDLVMASLLVGAIELARATPAWPPGNDPARANAILNEGTLLSDFLATEPGIAPRAAWEDAEALVNPRVRPQTDG